MTGQPRPQRQLTLNVQLRDESTLNNYLSSEAAKPIIMALQQQLQAGGEPVLYLFGPKDTGKSHLLQAACHLAGSAALYLPLTELASYSPEEVLQGVEAMSLVCLDDIDAVLGNEEWELALFNFYNRAREVGCRLLVSAPAAPRVVAVDLPDLRSRLSWGVVFQLEQARDEDKQQILIFRAARRGLQMPAEVANYIVNRAPRGLSPLLELLDQLDTASLAEKRPLSIPFVKEQLNW